MTSKLEIRHKQRQDEIINAARRCFRRCGFHAASMSQIASEAQLSVGQIYRYFANKDAIIEEMVRRIIDFRIAQMDIDARMPKWTLTRVPITSRKSLPCVNP